MKRSSKVWQRLFCQELLRFAQQVYLLSLITQSGKSVEIDGRIYRQIDETTVPYLGYMQERQSYYIVSDKTKRYDILKKIGIPEKKLSLAIAKELRNAYLMPFMLMILSSCFAVRLLEKMMSADLRAVNLISILIILIIFILFYGLSVIFYKKNAGLRRL